MKQNLVCYHCASTILPGELVETQLAGVNRSFCCPGCMAIAQTIHGQGLEAFYSRRIPLGRKPEDLKDLNNEIQLTDAIRLSLENNNIVICI